MLGLLVLATYLRYLTTPVTMQLQLGILRSSQTLCKRCFAKVILMRKGKLRSLGPLEIFIITVGFTAITLVSFSITLTSSIFQKNKSLIAANQSLQRNVALAHLWFEEAMQDDSSINLAQDVYANIDESILLCNVISGYGSSFGQIQAVNKAEARARARVISQKLQIWRIATQQRWRNRAFSKPGSKADQDYDAIFQEILQLSVQEQFALEAALAQEQVMLRWINTGIILLLLLLFVGMTGIVIRNRRAIESKSAENELILNSVGEGIYELDLHGTAIFVNLAVAQMGGYRVEELIGKRLHDIIHHSKVDKTPYAWQESPIYTTLQEGKVYSVTNEVFWRLDGTSFTVEYTSTPLKKQGKLMGAVVSFQDVTERKQAEADIHSALEKEKQLGELKSRFVAMTSHEFRTPLTTILSSSELLELYSHKWSEEKKLNHLRRIQVAVKQMTSLLNDVLLVGKASAGKLEFHPMPLDLVKFCRDLVEEMKLTSVAHQIAFVTQAVCTSSQCVAACMDEKLLRHIFSNLLSNAIKYSPQGSTIDFSLVFQQEYAVFQVTDRGIGIPIADQDKLFDSFHRASNVGTISGTGLGLAIVKKSVDLHGGNITVKSDVGVGTTITVNLPVNN